MRQIAAFEESSAVQASPALQPYEHFSRGWPRMHRMSHHKSVSQRATSKHHHCHGPPQICVFKLGRAVSRSHCPTNQMIRTSLRPPPSLLCTPRLANSEARRIDTHRLVSRACSPGMVSRMLQAHQGRDYQGTGSVHDRTPPA